MIEYAVLGSGSNANAYFFSNGSGSFIVDNGFSCRECLRRIEELGFDHSLIRYIFVTHTHADHIRGIKVLSKKLKAPVVVHRDCRIDSHVKGSVFRKVPILQSEAVDFDGIRVTPFLTSHDVPNSLGYYIEMGHAAFAIVTDTGEITDEIYHWTRQAAVLLLEANYDEQMLESGPYPRDLKKRIASRKGHLSNRDAVELLNRLSSDSGSRVKTVYFCHLSRNNNSPQVLQKYLDDHLEWKGNAVICPRGALCKGDSLLVQTEQLI